MRVTRELFYPGQDGLAVYGQNPSYTSIAGRSLLISMKAEALHFDDEGRRVYYHPRIWRRRSDDNGQSWTDLPDLHTEEPTRLAAGRQWHVPIHILSEANDTLICVQCSYDVDAAEDMFKHGNLRQRTYRPWVSFSRDGGQTWTQPQPIIDDRPGYDATHFGKELKTGETGAMVDLASYVWLPDGRLVLGFTTTNVGSGDDDDSPEARDNPMAKTATGVVYVQGKWDDAGQDMTWRFGDMIRAPLSFAAAGCCEPAVAHLGGDRLCVVMRCQGHEERGLPSRRGMATSDDGGMTWTEIQPLRYDDHHDDDQRDDRNRDDDPHAGTVWTPASLSAFFKPKGSTKTYWLANILDAPVSRQLPRYPLAIAEFDAERCCILRDTVQTVIARKAGTPEQVRYTNWGMHEDRDTGDLMLYLPEQPKRMDFTAMTKSEDFDADCHRYRVTLD